MTDEILIVDDNERVFQSLAINFQKNGLTCHWAPDKDAALGAAAANRLSAAIIDLSLGSESGLDVMRELMRLRPALPVVFISGFGTLEAAVAAMKLGAYDFLAKPLDFKQLDQVVRKAIASSRADSAAGAEAGTAAATGAGAVAASDPAAPAADSQRTAAAAGLVYASPAMDNLLRQAANAAATDIPVLVTGESGTGKELIVDYIHARSRRAAKPLVRVNCSAIVDSLAESELFGHTKGSFTGADDDHAGYFEQADGGTLHLAEIGDMSMAIQAKLLRTLESSFIRLVGGRRERRVDVRVVASTNRNPAALVEQGLFRNDLLYRINALHLDIPPLRDRPEDVPVLIRHFLAVMPEREGKKRFSVEAEKRLLAYAWPGNVRELKNMVKVCALLTPGMIIDVADLPNSVTAAPTTESAAPSTAAGAASGRIAAGSQSGRLEDVEKVALRNVLAEVGGNRRKAAERLGISVRSLYYKLERYGLS
ncbi:MAG: sigma-54 dependent transcriptional regulator [Planctomycetes bacterium]|nr:sigma-54 dependent transcriptional regulator [Planctomycetota bacterium]